MWLVRVLCRLVGWFLLAVLVILVAICVYPQVFEPEVPFEYNLGSVTHNSVIIWARAVDARQLRARLCAATGECWLVGPFEPDPSRDYTAVTAVPDLLPDSRYTYAVLRDDEAAESAKAYEFRTFPEPGTSVRVDFVYGSCMVPTPPVERGVFTYWRNHIKPAFGLILGDTIYADFPLPIDRNRAYHHLMGEPHFAAYLRHVPTFFTTDDHEFTNNYDGGEDGAEFKAGIWNYDSYIGRRSHTYGVEEGVRFETFDYGDLSFFITDTRAHRSRNHLPDNADKTILGAKQKAAVKEWLLADGHTFKFLVSSSPFSVDGDAWVYIDHVIEGRADGWHLFQTEREEIFDFACEHNVTGLVLLSGDLHWAAEFRLRPNLHEFSASPLFAPPTFPRSKTKGELVYAHGGTMHFASVVADTRTERPSVTVRIHSFLRDQQAPRVVHERTVYREETTACNARP